MLSSKRPSDCILSHWYVLQDNFQFSTDEFYTEIEKELAARQAPGLKISRVDFYEGGALSDKRTYLRLARERYAFDVCAAPFGREYFFSLRFVETPRSGLLALFLMFVLLYLLFVFILNTSVQTLVVLVVLALIAFVYIRMNKLSPNESTNKGTQLRTLNSIGTLADFDDFILNLPGIGRWYERFRKDTYYRQDTRMMYHTLIAEIVKRKVEEVTAAKGVKLIRSYEYNPILGELYKSAAVKPTQDATAST